MRRVLVSLLALAGLITVGLVSAPAVVAGATTGSSIYDSTVSPLPGNVVSEAFAATETSELGNQIKFSSGSGRVLTSVVVGLSSWGCQTGNWSADNCSTPANATFPEPITLNLYNVGAGRHRGRDQDRLADPDLQHPAPPLGRRQLHHRLPG